jgi:hypothetical protein
MSELEAWIRSKNMKSKDLCDSVKCSRPTLWKAKKQIPISKKYADKIFELTGVKVVTIEPTKEKRVKKSSILRETMNISTK